MSRSVPSSAAAASPTFLDTEDAASFLRISPRTLERMRWSGSGPRFRKHGGRVLYAVTDILAWSDQRVRSSTSDRATVSRGR